MSELTLNEQEHKTRAIALTQLFTTTEKLAEFLHQNYRATAKSFHVPGPLSHDHGFSDCYGSYKRYFLRRALWLMSEEPHANGRIK